MGLFDYVHVTDDDRFVCSEGHRLDAEEFQSKDFGCTMGDVTIAAGKISMAGGGWGHAENAPFHEHVEIYCACSRCPAFVQFGTANLIPCSVEFRLRIHGDQVLTVERTSAPTAEWLLSEPAQAWMKRCEGPMPFEDAQHLHRNYATLRPEHFAEWDAERAARAAAWRKEHPSGDVE